MPVFLDTEGLTSIAIAVCDRCKMKKPYVDLRPDGNSPGLRVCGDGCYDTKDPYRLPARQTERINLRFARPDSPLNEDTGGIPYGGKVLE